MEVRTVCHHALREGLEAFYAQYNPAKLAEVDQILETWHGAERQLVAALDEKYATRFLSRFLDGQLAMEGRESTTHHDKPLPSLPQQSLPSAVSLTEQTLAELEGTTLYSALCRAVEVKDIPKSAMNSHGSAGSFGVRLSGRTH
eukprot:Sspe_Gene.83046::Locus_54477_Transcript_1_1_Confidence_1.000_Length_496::g.83046::m.83046